MTDIRFTLLTDGSSDAILLYHLSWLLRQHLNSRLAIQSQWADLRTLQRQPKSLAERINLALEYYPCDLLFIHRDAEGELRNNRVEEIERAIEAANHDTRPYVCVVPVKMQEAWLLFDEAAIRQAAGNPKGRRRLDLPSLRKTEKLADPKQALHEALRTATEFSGRKLKKFDVRHSVRQVAAYIENFSPLRALSAFELLESDTIAAITVNGWN